ncbi:MAG: hypothetical protein LBJ46_01490 [Planctomycetota bacterium]|jgi:hypothetical protein|nr:hypothetical protein [Planctomycetota bacterium]
MKSKDGVGVTPKHLQKVTKKVISYAGRVDDAEAKFMKELWLAISVDLVFHPKLLCLAIELGIDEAHALGVLVRMWLMTFKYAKDGELWRGSDDATLQFIGVVTGYKGDVKRLVDGLRKYRWLDDWLIHDWLDYVGPFLIKSYKTSRRAWLVETWEKHGRTYGARPAREGDDAGTDGEDFADGGSPDGEPPDDDGAPRSEAEQEEKPSGTAQEPIRNQAGTRQELQPKPLHNPIPTQPINREIEPKTLSPPAQGNKKLKALNGGMGGIATVRDVLGGMAAEKAIEPAKDKGFLNFVKEGGRAEGLNTLDFPLSLVIIEDVYAVYRNLLRFHGVLTTRLLREKVKYCQATPAAWIILLQDKVHAAYRERDGGALIETDGADPVGMTIAALRPQRGDKRHFGTEASTNLFTEVMIDFVQMCCGQTSVWQNRLSGAAIAFELGRRKGKRGRSRT